MVTALLVVVAAVGGGALGFLCGVAAVILQVRSIIAAHAANDNNTDITQ